MGFTHLHVHSNFSFLDAGSSVQSLVDRAKSLNYKALSLTDHNGLYGAVRFYDYAKKSGIKPIIGAELDLEDGHHLVLLAKNLNGYSNLARIITRAHLSHEKGEFAANLNLINEYKQDLFCLSGCINGKVPAFTAKGDISGAEKAASELLDIFGADSFFIELQNHMLQGDTLQNQRLSQIADRFGLRCVATNNVHYASKEDFKVQDLLTCVRTITTLDEANPLRRRNAEYYLKSPRAMSAIFSKYPRAVATAGWIAGQCNLDLKLGTYRFPEFPVPDGETAYSYLYKLCFEAVNRLYKPVTPEVTERLQYELKIINDLGFAEYFLVVWDIVNFSKSKGIRCSGRGSAADSLVAYCLGITIADPIEHNLLFERFLNPERKGMPDIDIDFDAARRDEVISYIYNRYGEDRVAMVCTVSTLRARSSLRDLGKAMDFTYEDVDRVASIIPHVGGRRIREAINNLPELRKSDLNMTRLESLVDICEKVDGFPRHLSVHLGGMVIGGTPLTDLVPLEWATKGVIVSQFDKDDIETLGLVKMDILGLRNLSAIEDCLKLLKAHHGIELDIDAIPLDDEPTYQMLRTCDTVGCFQVESPGMRGLLGRLQPEKFDDIIAQISLFRPGPMQADMINPYIARRHGEEAVSYLHPSLEPALKETFGVILYQEQVIGVANALAGFTYGQADLLRRAMTTDRSQEEMEKIRAGFVSGSIARGVDAKTAEEVFSKLRAFAAYGFCKAHAASFAKIAYQTAYLKTHHPAEFLTGILNNEPMGFYPPNVIIEEARHLGIRLLGIDINKSDKTFTVEYDEAGVPGIRISISSISNISSAEVKSIVSARDNRPFASFSDFCSRAGCERTTIENLINCGAFETFGIPSRKLLWMLNEVKVEKRKRRVDAGPTLIDCSDISTLDDNAHKLPDFPEPTLHERVRMDYNILGFSTICHPMIFYREKLSKDRVITSTRVKELPNNTIVRVAGVVVVCMRPPTRSGKIVVFITLEDELGLIDCVVFPKVYEQYGKVIYDNHALIIEGRMQRQGKSVSILVSKVMPLASRYCSDGSSPQGSKERIRIAGQRSFIRSVSV